MTQPSMTIEWTSEAAWITVLQASTPLVSLLAGTTSIHREYDQSTGVADTLPKVLVSCPGARPMVRRGEGYYIAPMRIEVVISLDDDPTGSKRAAIAGAVRNVFEASGLIAALEVAQPTLKIGMIEQPDPPYIGDEPAAAKPTRRLMYEYQMQCTMLDELVNPD